MRRSRVLVFVVATTVSFFFGWIASRKIDKRPVKSSTSIPIDSPGISAQREDHGPSTELLRLRSQVNRQRSVNADLIQQLSNAIQEKADSSKTPEPVALMPGGPAETILREELNDQGTQTPRAAALTWLWASATTNHARIKELWGDSAVDVGNDLLGVVSAEVIPLSSPDGGSQIMRLKVTMGTGKEGSILLGFGQGDEKRKIINFSTTLP